MSHVLIIQCYFRRMRLAGGNLQRDDVFLFCWFGDVLTWGHIAHRGHRSCKWCCPFQPCAMIVDPPHVRPRSSMISRGMEMSY